jgi:hypothetical protein
MIVPGILKERNAADTALYAAAVESLCEMRAGL